MNQDSPNAAKPASRRPVFFWITIGLLALLVLGGAVAALLLVFQAREINRSGGWGWLLVAGIGVAAIAVVGAGCALCTTISLFRRERYRGLSIAILVISCLVLFVFGSGLIHIAVNVRRQHAEANRASKSTARAPANDPSAAAADKSSSAPATREVEDPQILELKSRIWEAIRAKNAGAFVDCYHVEARFNTPEIREENLKQAEILLNGETVDVEIREIPAKEMVEIMKVQNAKPASLVRYSLVPKMMLVIRQKAGNGTRGRRFLIGEQNGKWQIITLAGRTT
jgi:hypothetical protein